MNDAIVCRLTGTYGPGADAHIIPRGFYDLSDEAGVTREVSGSADIHPRRLPIGAYDRRILTVEGERVFSPWDRYAHELLVRDKARLCEVTRLGRALEFTLPVFDYWKLKLFFLSVLWRASVSTLPGFSRASLGPHEELIRQQLLTGDAGTAERYSVGLTMFWDKPSGVGMLDPHPVRFSGVNYVHLSVGPYVAFVKVDKRPTPTEFVDAQLTPDMPLRIEAREFATSAERAVMLRVARLHPRPALAARLAGRDVRR